MNCKYCKFFRRYSSIIKRDKLTGDEFHVLTLNGIPQYDKTKFDLINVYETSGGCEKIEETGDVSAGTTYGDGLMFSENFGCIHFKDK